MQKGSMRLYELPREMIFRGKREFAAVYNHGRSYANGKMVLYVLRSDGLEGRVGFAAGKKLGGAVVRNRVKRMLREAYRLFQHEIRADYAIILVGRKTLVEAKSNVVSEAFRELCTRAKILKR